MRSQSDVQTGGLPSASLGRRTCRPSCSPARLRGWSPDSPCCSGHSAVDLLYITRPPKKKHGLVIYNVELACLIAGLVAFARRKMRLLELFSGTGSIGRAFAAKGWEVVSVDLEPKFEPTLSSPVCAARAGRGPRGRGAAG